MLNARLARGQTHALGHGIVNLLALQKTAQFRQQKAQQYLGCRGIGGGLRALDDGFRQIVQLGRFAVTPHFFAV